MKNPSRWVQASGGVVNLFTLIEVYMSNSIKVWNERQIRIRADRYVSLTDMAQASGKLFADWKRLKTTDSYLATLSSIMGIPIMKLIESQVGGSPEKTGTWGHPKVAIRFAQWCSDEFAVQVDFWIDELLTKGSVSLSTENGEPYWYARLKQFRQDNPVPEGYYSIFEETINLVAEFEALDCIIPDSAIPDISIGKHWATYLRDEHNIEPNKICTTYPHTYPGKYDKRGTQWANAYPEEMLPLFRQWFRSTYRPVKLPAYIKRQHKGLLPVVGQLLGLSMAEMKRLK